MASCSQPPPPPPPDPAIPSQPTTDIELAKMLRALVDPSATPAGKNSLIIHEADVYAHDPADLTRHFASTVAEDGQKEAWYFFTKLEPKSQQGGKKRKRRCMESGVWHDEGKSKPIVGSQARRYLFAFLNKVDGARTGWIMHEFRLPVPDGDEESPIVLCKVFRSSRRCAPNPAMSNEPEAAQAQAEVEVEEEVEGVEAREAAVEARETAVEAREAAVEARETAVEAREAAVEARETAVEAREAATLPAGWALRQALEAVWSLKRSAAWGAEAREAAGSAAWQAWEAAWEAARRSLTGLTAWEAWGTWEAEERLRAELAAWQALLQAGKGMLLTWFRTRMLSHNPTLRAEFERRLGELVRLAGLEREAELREAEGEGLARRDAARLAELERNLEERERNLAPWEETRLQELQAELTAELEALVLILMAAAAAALLVARAGLLLLLPIAGGSRAAVAHCGGALEPLF